MFENGKQVHEVVKRAFDKQTILVVGDLILDRYLWGEVNRISPESPVPVVQFVRENEVGGGAANVALNLSGLGLQVAVAGFVGNDPNRDRLLEILRQEDINIDGVVTRAGLPTITKTRIIGGRQQMLRVDRETIRFSQDTNTEELLSKINQKIKGGVAAIILSDYAKGVLSEHVCKKVIAEARESGIPVFIDPKGQNFDKYAGATAISPNLKELAAACHMPLQPLDALFDAGQALVKKLQLNFMGVTLGELGIALIEKTHIRRIPALAREVFDVSGAGDTVIATLTAGQAAGLNRLDSLHLANVAAGVVVGKVGTAPIHQADLLAALSTEEVLTQSEKICLLKPLLSKINEWRAKGERIVFTNGCFDLLHVGHVTFLSEAKRLGNRLIVGLNTDRSVRALKGESRPVISQDDRARVLAALTAVDAVILFDEDTPLRLIKAVRPDVLAKGSDYTVDQVVGAEELKAWGGEVALIQLVHGKSSSKIVKSLQAEHPSPS